MNCAEPANTSSDMPMVCHADSPAPTASVPKMMPKGMAPTISGRISRQPCKNSCERDIGAPWGPQRNRLYAAVALQRTEYRRRIDDAGRIARENGKPYPMLAVEATGPYGDTGQSPRGSAGNAQMVLR